MTRKNFQQGFSTIELLIASALALMFLSAMFVVSFGDQSTILGGETNAEATAKTQAMIEQQQANGRQDFNLVNGTTTTDGIYTKKVTVDLIDPWTKLVTASTTWIGDHKQTLNTTITTLVTNTENVNSPNSCNSSLSGNWGNAQIGAPIDVGDSSSSGNPVTDLDVFDGKLYITTDNTHGNNPDFYVYDISTNPQIPTLVPNSAVQIDPGSQGLSAVSVASSGGERYAFIANAKTTNFNTCKPSTGVNCSQLEVMKVTNPASPGPIISYLIPTSTLPFVVGTGGNAIAKTVFYKDGYLYVGLSTTNNGSGFHVIDVHNPTNPVWVSSWPVSSVTFGPSGAPINNINIRGNYAYLSHPTGLIGPSGVLSEQLTVLDISNPLAPVRVSGFFDNGGIGGNGKGAFPIGNKLYFIRTWTSNSHREFYILNNSNPTNLSTNNPNPPEPLGKVIGETVQGAVVRDKYAFLISSTTIQILDVSSVLLPSIKSWSISTIAGVASAGTSAECAGNFVYFASFRTSNLKGSILVASPGP